MKKTLQNHVHKLVILSVVLFASFAASGCLVIDDEYIGDYYESYVDLRVTWSVDGSDAEYLCDSYGIDTWRVSISGPDARTIEIDCRKYYWSSESDFFSIIEGDYRITVSALDANYRVLATKSSDNYLWDSLYTEKEHFNFSSWDF